MTSKPQTIDEYLANRREDQQLALQQLRAHIRQAAPEAQECISYQVPAFRLRGRLLVGFGAAAKHCSLYPMSSAVIEAFAEELKDYQTSRGTIRFQVDRPLPASLVHRLVQARIAENAAK